MRLLDVIYQRSNEIYLSDFHMPETILRNIKLINSIEDDAYSLEEWEYLYNYIVGAQSNCKTVKEIKKKLEKYARSNLDSHIFLGKKWKW